MANLPLLPLAIMWAIAYMIYREFMAAMSAARRANKEEPQALFALHRPAR
jgi:hypothetical protein